MAHDLAVWDTALWRRARAAFDQIMTVAPASRPTRLAEVCGSDRALGRAVEALIEHDETLAGPRQAGRSTPTSAEVGRRWLGLRLGAYRLLRVIGCGGTGIVFLAVRDDQAFDHQVAVKILLEGLDAGAGRRFRRERQLLAQLDHPHIARLIDGGATDDGCLYVVMEHVAGDPITVHCDRTRASIDERLRLFLQVCDAVQHAHRLLVVHRDLKPSNILVTADGDAKLLDFGIAKLLDESGVDRPPAGAPTTAWLTPAYASPEQLLGGTTTLVTDVYALGTLLYELLTGLRPHEVSGDPDGMSLVRSVVPPSAAVRGADGPAEAAFDRGLTPASLARRLRGDLDEIVLRAIRDAPAERYPSVDALARDVASYRADLPVAARRGNAAYRTGKLVRRHPIAIAVATVLVLATLTFAGLAYRQSVALAAEQRATARQRDAAEAIADNLAELVRELQPVKGHAFDAAVRQILGRSGARIASELADQPALEAVLSRELGTVYRELAYLGEAEPLLERAVAYWRDEVSDPAEHARALHALGGLRFEQGRFDEAERLLRAELTLRDGPTAADPAERITAMTKLADVLWARSETEEARAWLERAIELGEETPDAAATDRAGARNSLATIAKTLGDFETATSLYVEALALFEEARGPESLEVAAVLNNLAALDVNRGDFGRGAERLRASLVIRRRLQGEDHPDVGVVEANLAATLHLAGDYAAAEPLYRAALARSQAAIGDDHPAVAFDLSNLGVLLREQGRLTEAEPYLRGSLSIRRAVLPAGHRDTGTSLHNVGLLELDRGHLAEARALFEEALAIRREALGGRHWMVGNSLNGLALEALAADDPCRARAHAGQAADILAEALPAGHWRHAVAESVLGAALGRLGDGARAQDLMTASARAIGAAKGEGSRAYSDALARLEQHGATPRPPSRACPDDGAVRSAGSPTP